MRRQAAMLPRLVAGPPGRPSDDRRRTVPVGSEHGSRGTTTARGGEWGSGRSPSGGERDLRERPPPLQQEDAAERHPRRGSPARALREAVGEAEAQGSEAQEGRPPAAELGRRRADQPGGDPPRRGWTNARGAMPVTVRDRIQTDVTTAMRSGDVLRRDTLRMAQSAVYNVEKAQRRPLSDDEALAVLAREVKTRRESVAAFRAGGRE